MYCIQCGVKLADTERQCPLCNTMVSHPTYTRKNVCPLYPENKLPKSTTSSKGLHGAVIFLFCIPLLVSLFADLSINGKIEWFGYVAGALVVAYITLALPFWFKKPNPVIFVPCDFAATGLYLWYINIATNGHWFFSFALPILIVSALITCAVVTLLYYLKKGALYVLGGAFMAVGAFLLLLELLIEITFDVAFLGWSLYPLTVLVIFGGLLIYLAINRTARETIKRKLFF